MDNLWLSQEELRARLNVPTGKLRLVIDTDAKNEVDDQFAIAWALRSPDRFLVEAVYAAPFSFGCFSRLNQDSENQKLADELNGSADDPSDGMEQSYQEIYKIFNLLHEETTDRIFRGSIAYLPKEGFVESEAARDLVRRAMDSEELLYIAAIGALTNIASAILMEPSIAQKIVIVWLGGEPHTYGHGIEYNLMQDVRAVQTVLNSGAPLIQIPCMSVASQLSATEDELRAKLLDKSEIGQYLAQICLDAFHNPEAAIAMMKLDRQGYLLGQNDQSEKYLNQFPTEWVAWSRIIWDISAIAFLKNPNWVPSKLISAPILTDDMKWICSDASRHFIRTATYCFRDMIFGDLFHSLAHN